jgi:diadenosine tetraphosphate (Ap4A) HIT family hydrolase
MLELLDAQKLVLDREFRPAAYNIGINDGPFAGQTVPHLHVHLIPRYPGDLPDPRGGVRWVLPAKAKYWPG